MPPRLAYDRIAEPWSMRVRASQLMAIPDAAYAAGLRQLERDIEAARPSTARARSKFVRLTITGSKPIGAGRR